MHNQLQYDCLIKEDVNNIDKPGYCMIDSTSSLPIPNIPLPEYVENTEMELELEPDENNDDK